MAAANDDTATSRIAYDDLPGWTARLEIRGMAKAHVYGALGVGAGAAGFSECSICVSRLNIMRNRGSRLMS